MLRVNLVDLYRAGTLHVRGEIPADDPLWDGVEELELAAAVTVDLAVTATATGQVLARGRVEAPLAHECRRCLAPLEQVLAEELTLVWAPPDEMEEGGDDAEIRRLELSDNELDLGNAVREELILSAPAYVLCREDCQGLCPRCGINRNVESCDCSLDEPDPRWDALRKLADE